MNFGQQYLSGRRLTARESATADQAVITVDLSEVRERDSIQLLVLTALL